MLRGSIAGEDTLRILKDNFVAVATNTMYSEDELHSSLGDLGNDFVVATAGGKALARGVHFDLVVKEALEAWKGLPESERRPGAVKVEKPEGKPERDIPPSPPGGLIVRTYTRALKRDAAGQVAAMSKQDIREREKETAQQRGLWNIERTINREPMPDILWLTEAEWKSLIPPQPRKGDSFPMPDPIQKRILRYYLLDTTVSFTSAWSLQALRSGGLKLTVEEVSPGVRLRLQGPVHLEDKGEGAAGYDAHLLGYLDYDMAKKVFTRFDIVVIGEYWDSASKGHHEYGWMHPPLGRYLIGIAFELARGDSARDHVPPIHFLMDGAASYFKAEGR